MDFGAEFLNENQTLGDIVVDADPGTPVPTCPGWAFKQLFRHVGGGNRWAAQIVADRLQDRLDFADIRDGRAPTDPAAARAWFAEGAQLLVDGVAEVGPDTQVWTFTGPKPASWWLRRRLHEVLVHRADVALALDAAFAPRPELAADALSEWLDLTITRMPDLAGRTVHLHASDDGLGEAGEWTIGNGGWAHAHGKGDVALRGPATDLLLVTTGRRPVGDTAVEVFGDTALLATWLDSTEF